jgi:hypothetical protein
VKQYFTAARLDPTSPPSEDEAWQVQGHLVLHILNDNVVAVPRSELLGSLIRGSTFDWDKEKGQWLMKVRALLLCCLLLLRLATCVLLTSLPPDNRWLLVKARPRRPCSHSCRAAPMPWFERG